ncbi:MAG: hypothetical protein ACFFCW_28925 [Candidatus Hodarchaeota archaeon]
MNCDRCGDKLTEGAVCVQCAIDLKHRTFLEEASKDLFTCLSECIDMYESDGCIGVKLFDDCKQLLSKIEALQSHLTSLGVQDEEKFHA